MRLRTFKKFSGIWGGIQKRIDGTEIFPLKTTIHIFTKNKNFNEYLFTNRYNNSITFQNTTKFSNCLADSNVVKFPGYCSSVSNIISNSWPTDKFNVARMNLNYYVSFSINSFNLLNVNLTEVDF